MSTRTTARAARKAAAAPADPTREVRLPLEHYRLIAAALLVVLLGVALLAPLGPRPLPATGLSTPSLEAPGPVFDQIVATVKPNRAYRISI